VYTGAYDIWHRKCLYIFAVNVYLFELPEVEFLQDETAGLCRVNLIV
jgi:hypothetical protein